MWRSGGRPFWEGHSREGDPCEQRQDVWNCRVCLDNYQVCSDWSPGAVKVSGSQSCEDKDERQPVELEVHSESRQRTLLEASWVESGMNRTVSPEDDLE